MSLANARLEVGDKGCAMDPRRGNRPMPCVVIWVDELGRHGVARFELDPERTCQVKLLEFYFEQEAS